MTDYSERVKQARRALTDAISKREWATHDQAAAADAAVDAAFDALARVIVEDDERVKALLAEMEEVRDWAVMTKGHPMAGHVIPERYGAWQVATEALAAFKEPSND